MSIPATDDFLTIFNAIYATPIGARVILTREGRSITVVRSRRKTLSRVVCSAARVDVAARVLRAIDAAGAGHVAFQRTGRDTVHAQVVVAVEMGDSVRKSLSATPTCVASSTITRTNELLHCTP
jgi:hypothetical protein